MRVLQVNATYATGSTGEIVCGIAHAGHKRGVETYFASSVPPEISSDDTVYVTLFKNFRKSRYVFLF